MSRMHVSLDICPAYNQGDVGSGKRGVVKLVTMDSVTESSNMGSWDQMLELSWPLLVLLEVV